jgi:dTDP-4-dehydrorhamnose reductase
MKIAVLGASGMLGSMVLSWLAQDEQFSVVATSRRRDSQDFSRRVAPRAELRSTDAETATIENLAQLLTGCVWAVNCIGVIKPFIKDDDPQQVERALRVNALFPHVLARAAEQAECRVLQIATDCAYSGTTGAYTESSPHDPLDVYGKTKSLGEVRNPWVHHLRCSIIGPEIHSRMSLLEWFRGQARDANVKGFLNHQWNGVTTLHFGKVCSGIIKGDVLLPHLQHVVPAGSISKADLLSSFAQAFSRTDITIERVAASTVIDRTLSTSDPELNARVWRAAGYAQPPTVVEMVNELAAFERELAATTSTATR